MSTRPSRSFPVPTRHSPPAGPLKGWEIALLALAVTSLVAFLLARTVGTSARTSSGFFSRTIRPAVAFWGEPVDVELRIEPSRLPTCGVITDTEPIYAVLVIDHSGSMVIEMGGLPLIEARNAAADFVQLMNLSPEHDAVAVVMFSDGANLLTTFSQDAARVVRLIQGIPEGGGTDIAAGLTMATQQFADQPPPAGTRSVIILLSDGGSDRAAAVAAAEDAKRLGIRVVTIALGSADQDTLRQIASSDGDYYETSDPTALVQIYGDIAAGFAGSIATAASLDEYWNDSAFRLEATGLYRVQQEDNHLQWQFAIVGGRGRNTGYTLHPLALGWPQVSPRPGQTGLTDCQGQPLSQETPVGPRVLVLFPVWLLFIFPALTLAWAIYRLVRALQPPPRAPVSIDVRRGKVPGPAATPDKPRRTGSPVTHGRPPKR